jgi:hypothetical protein
MYIYRYGFQDHGEGTHLVHELRSQRCKRYPLLTLAASTGSRAGKEVTHLPFLIFVDLGLGGVFCAAGYGYIYADKQSPTLKLTDKVRHNIPRRDDVDGFHTTTPTQRLDTNKRGALGGTLAQVYAASQTKHGWLLYNGSASPWVVGVGKL